MRRLSRSTVNFGSLVDVTVVTSATCDVIQATCLTDVEIPVTETEDMPTEIPVLTVPTVPTVPTETMRAEENGAMCAMAAMAVTAGIETAGMAVRAAMAAMAGIETDVMAAMSVMAGTVMAGMAVRIETAMIVTIGAVLHWKGAPVTVTEAVQAMREALGKVDMLPLKLPNLTVKNRVTGTGGKALREKPKKAAAAALQLQQLQVLPFRSHKLYEVMTRPSLGKTARKQEEVRPSYQSVACQDQLWDLQLLLPATSLTSPAQL